MDFVIIQPILTSVMTPGNHWVLRFLAVMKRFRGLLEKKGAPALALRKNGEIYSVSALEMARLNPPVEFLIRTGN